MNPWLNELNKNIKNSLHAIGFRFGCVDFKRWTMGVTKQYFGNGKYVYEAYRAVRKINYNNFQACFTVSKFGETQAKKMAEKIQKILDSFSSKADHKIIRFSLDMCKKSMIQEFENEREIKNIKRNIRNKKSS